DQSLCPSSTFVISMLANCGCMSASSLLFLEQDAKNNAAINKSEIFLKVFIFLCLSFDEIHI
ncbi:hypothetical protein, partial [Flammeovirga pacifica]|uniref:hypothetical protein n=1 Tax=Flammeovirga pacifica TaxID=915059 RepID=UPI001A8FB64E